MHIDKHKTEPITDSINPELKIEVKMLRHKDEIPIAVAIKLAEYMASFRNYYLPFIPMGETK